MLAASRQSVRYLSSSSVITRSSVPTTSAPTGVTPNQPFEIHSLNPWAGGALSKSGTGGRSSVSGVVATVFGATGFVGRYVVNRLGASGSQIVVPYRGDEHAYRHLKPMADLGQIVFSPYDIRDTDKVKRLVERSNVVINLTGRDYATRNFSLKDIHVTGAETIARASAEAGVSKLIHLSALGANENSPSEFLKTKALGEQAVRAAFPNATILRPSTIFGVEDRFFSRFGNFLRLPFGIPLQNYGETKRQPVYVVDVAKAVISAINNNNSAKKTYELVGPTEYTVEAIVNYMYDVARRPPKAYHIPSPIYDFIASLLEKNPLYAPILTKDLAIRERLDEVTTGLPGLEDLNVHPTRVEEVSITFLRTYRRHVYFDEAPKDTTA